MGKLVREKRADNCPEPGRQYLRDTFGQSDWAMRERFVSLLGWLALLGNTAGMGGVAQGFRLSKSRKMGNLLRSFRESNKDCLGADDVNRPRTGAS